MHMDAFDNEDVIAQYLAYQTQVAGRRWRPATVRARRYQLRKISEHVPRGFQVATEEELIAWYRTLEGAPPETIAAYRSAVRGLFRWMIVKARPRLRTDDPTLILERPIVPEGVPRPMLDRHYDLALACAVSQPEMYLWLGLMGCSGLRCCEIAWMQTADIETLANGGGLLHVVGKGGKRRTVPVGTILLATMHPFLRARGPVFTRPSDGRAHTPNSVSQRVNGFLRDVGVPAPATAHTLRHRFGTDYHAIDPDLYAQAKIMGHASVDTTARYTAVLPIEAAHHIEVLTMQRLSPDRGRSRRTSSAA